MKKLVVTCLLCQMVLPLCAGIMIHPKFLFLDDKTKSAEIMLVNSDAAQSANYRISLSYKKQNPDGSYTDIPLDQPLPPDSAVNLLRYSPRSVMLPPSKGQTVRVLKRLPEGLAPGEYIAYITFTEVLLEKPLTKQNLSSQEFSVQLTAIPSFSIPIFVRHQVSEISPALIEAGQLTEVNGKPQLNIILRRQKRSDKPVSSIRGDLSVWKDGKMLGMVRGRYLLPGTEQLPTRIILQNEDNTLHLKDLKGKAVTVLFTESGNQLQPDKKLAETTITL